MLLNRGPSYPSRLKKAITPQSKGTYFSSDQIVKTLPDERTTTSKKQLDTQNSLSQQVLESRLFYIEQLAESLKPNMTFEIQRILSSLQQIGKTLKNISRTEIDLNLRNKMLESATLESLQQKQTIQRLKEQQGHFKQDNQDQILKLHLTHQDHTKLRKELMHQKKLTDEQYKKIKYLEKRIEMMLEKNLNTHQDELRNTLSNLITENEQLKRNLLRQEKDNERFKELNSKLVAQNLRLSKKLDSLKTKKVGVKQEFTLPEENVQIHNYAFDPNSLPQNLEFRLVTLQTEEHDFLIDLIEHGPDVFTNQVINVESLQQKRDLITLVANQFISGRNFAEKLNLIMSEIIILNSYKNIQDFQIHISKAFRSIFNTDIVNLWIIDGMTCRADTFDCNGNHHVALLTDGVFSQIVFNDYGVRSPSKETQLLYITEKEQIFAKNFLLLPIMGNSKKPCGILEIQNISQDIFLDAQYYGLLINMLSKSVIQSILDYEALAKELKFRDFYQQSFINMALCRSKDKFAMTILESAFHIFQIAQTQLLFVEGEYFMKMDGRKYQLDAGCAYQVYKSKNSQIFTSINRNIHYDENVDISSILPVFVAPLIRNDKVEAILQFIVKKKFMIDKHPFGNQANIGFKFDTADQDAVRFYQIVQKAYEIMMNNI